MKNLATTYPNKLFFMKSKIAQTIIAGLVATGVMTAVGLMAPYMGLAKMNPAEMLANMMGISIMLGYLMHFMIGIIFAGIYVYLFNAKVHIHSKLIKGLLYGFVVFIFAQIMLFIIGKIMPMPMSNDNMMLLMLGSLISHLVFGVVVALIVPAHTIVNANNNFRNANA